MNIKQFRNLRIIIYRPLIWHSFMTLHHQRCENLEPRRKFVFVMNLFAHKWLPRITNHP